MLELEAHDVAALREAYTGICRARRRYTRLIERLGSVAPLPELRDEASGQIEKLEALFERCGIEVPHLEHGWPIRRYNTIPQAVDAALCRRARSDVARESLQIVVHEARVRHLED